MSLVTNIGIGKIVNNPFYHYIADGDKWVKRLKEFDLMPKKELFVDIDELTYSYVFHSSSNQLALFIDVKSYGESYTFRVIFNAEENSVCAEDGFNQYIKYLQKKWPKAFVGKAIYGYRWLYYI